MTELAGRVGFDSVDLHLPMTGSDYPELFAECLANEHECTPEHPHTLILEMLKNV